LRASGFTGGLVITYDEHGGFCDHFPPPPACVPDNVPPARGPGNVPATFDRYGFRVPVMVVSPWSRREAFGWVSRQTSRRFALRYL